MPSRIVEWVLLSSTYFNSKSSSCNLLNSFSLRNIWLLPCIYFWAFLCFFKSCHSMETVEVAFVKSSLISSPLLLLLSQNFNSSLILFLLNLFCSNIFDCLIPQASTHNFPHYTTEPDWKYNISNCQHFTASNLATILRPAIARQFANWMIRFEN